MFYNHHLERNLVHMIEPPWVLSAPGNFSAAGRSDSVEAPLTPFARLITGWRSRAFADHVQTMIGCRPPRCHRISERASKEGLDLTTPGMRTECRVNSAVPCRSCGSAAASPAVDRPADPCRPFVTARLVTGKRRLGSDSWLIIRANNLGLCYGPVYSLEPTGDKRPRRAVVLDMTGPSRPGFGGHDVFAAHRQHCAGQ